MGEPNKLLDTSAAEAYEKLLVPTLNAPLATEAVELAAPGLWIAILRTVKAARAPVSAPPKAREVRFFEHRSADGVQKANVH